MKKMAACVWQFPPEKWKNKTVRIETYTSRFGGKVLTDEKSLDFFNVPELHPTRSQVAVTASHRHSAAPPRRRVADVPSRRASPYRRTVHCRRVAGVPSRRPSP